MKKILAAAAFLALGTAGAYAADLSAPVVEAPAPAAASPNIYVQLLGGAAFGLDSEFYNAGLDENYTDGMDSGWAFGGSLGVMVMDNFAIEGDILHTARDYSDYDGGVSTTSLMINGKFIVPVSDGLDIYVGAGIGFITANDTFEGVDLDYSGLGYQLIGGVAVKVADHISLVGELRYQDGFSPLSGTDGNDNTIDPPVAAALVGLKFSF
jgi:opacity protein-like surface antigen